MITDADVWTAAKEANVDDIIMGLYRKYDTTLRSKDSIWVVGGYRLPECLQGRESDVLIVCVGCGDNQNMLCWMPFVYEDEGEEAVNGGTVVDKQRHQISFSIYVGCHKYPEFPEIMGKYRNRPYSLICTSEIFQFEVFPKKWHKNLACCQNNSLKSRKIHF